MQGRLGYLYHSHLTEALSQRRRLASTVKTANSDDSGSMPRETSRTSSLVSGCVTVLVLGIMLALAVVVRIAATSQA